MEDPAAADQNHVLEFRLPDLGEGLTDAELVSWAVAVGDRVELNQTIAEVETAKAQVALPCPFAGEVLELLAQPGDTVPVGAPLIRVATEFAVTPPEVVETSERQAVLVGYGPESDIGSRRKRPATNTVAIQPDSETTPTYPDIPGRPPATPAARKLARELGIDISFVAGSGPGGAVTVEDVRHAVPVSQPPGRARQDAAADSDEPRPSTPPVPTMRPDGGIIRAVPSTRETRTPVSGVRKRTAAAMVASARTIPQASAFATTDFTASMELLDHLRSTDSFSGLSLTPLALVAKAALAAMAEFPGINSSWDEERREIVTKHYVNLGIAVATDRGLLVPSVKEAQSLSLRELCREIGWLADVTRSGSATPADLRGGTFTISNVGVFGVDTGVPLVNPGEGAILCLGSIRKQPWVYRDELAVRWVTTLGISFDHRMIDGELGARFLATVASLLEDPLTLLGRV
ncbi:pyruvate dehydrogenase E2 component (dihydrolipoamide acetyltransferase) [Nocardia transvalensis]|uniref:Dihydrolipoamide acetyltransferase component of pyruvate dehydrogenase complex n=1 Tax=Nocardia transvalensis TaxID=37333 RepID=A0A7W9UIX5_9NOCA|nr:dihydrolipoamide acetyltransferase family protein [Nocardia transvalensis]MBB5914868.1 pyruvate dehydrogenase E2 component (dihydrolipoamide acetyltransferase) [Nocardia transvalensis]